MWSSNTDNTFMGELHPSPEMETRNSRKEEQKAFTLTSGWSGATPNRTSPKGMGRRSYMSTWTAGCICKIEKEHKNQYIEENGKAFFFIAGYISLGNL